MVKHNIFRILADFTHLASILILLYKIQKHKSAEGISLKTQILYFIVFCARYVGLFLIFLFIIY
jgi:ER lumen protein retaining receptor